MAVSDFDNIAAVNYRGVWLCAREEAKYMKNQSPLPTHDGRQGYRGSIVNIASDLGYNTESGRSEWPIGITKSTFSLLMFSIAAYCSTKAAVIHMTKCDAVDVRIPCVLLRCMLIMYLVRDAQYPGQLCCTWFSRVRETSRILKTTANYFKVHRSQKTFPTLACR